MQDNDKKLIANLAITFFCLFGFGFIWRETFGDSEFSMIMMCTVGTVLIVALTQKLRD